MATQKEVEVYRAAVEIYCAGIPVNESIELAVKIWNGVRDKLYKNAKDSLGKMTEGDGVAAG